MRLRDPSEERRQEREAAQRLESTLSEARKLRTEANNLLQRMVMEEYHDRNRVQGFIQEMGFFQGAVQLAEEVADDFKTKKVDRLRVLNEILQLKGAITHMRDVSTLKSTDIPRGHVTGRKSPNVVPFEKNEESED